MQTKEIKGVVTAIREAKLAGVPEHRIRYNYRDFHKRLPHLFNAALNPDFELKYLDMMLTHMQNATRVNNTEQRERAFDEADEAIIGKLREDFLDPLLANAPRTDTPQEPVINVLNGDDWGKDGVSV